MGEQWGSLKDNKREKIEKRKKRKEKKKKNFFLNLATKQQNMPIYIGISLELLQSVQVQFNFVQLLFPAYTSRYLQAPSGVVGITFRDFNLLHPSFLKRFPLFGFCLPSLRCLISALTQAGGGGLLFRFTSSVQSCCGEGGALQTDIAVCGEHLPCSGRTGFAPYRGVCAFPVCTAQAPGCSIWSRPCVECGSSFRVLHNSANSVVPAFCAFPGLSGSGSQRLGRPLPGCGAPFPSVAPARASGVPLPIFQNEMVTLAVKILSYYNNLTKLTYFK